MSKDTARQEVEKVCFAYEKAGKTGNKKDWSKFYDLEEQLIKKVAVANQPKLSLPKKIAEELEEYDIGEKGNYSLFSLSEEAREFYLTHNNIVTIYFASKALGVELVGVTDE